MHNLALTLFAALAAQDPQPVAARVEALVAESGGVATQTRIGTSRGGRPLLALALAATGGRPPEERPAVLVLAGIDGRDALGTELTLHHARAMLTAVAAGDETATQLLTDQVIYLVPQLNPDGAALGRAGNAMTIDRDRDGAVDEDGPDDLDGGRSDRADAVAGSRGTLADRPRRATTDAAR